MVERSELEPLRPGCEYEYNLGFRRLGSRRRSRAGSEQFCGCELFRAAIDPRQALVINEIMYRPAVSNASYVEIFNRSTNISFDLSGWRVSGIDYTFPEGAVITNRQFLVLAK